MIEQMRTKDNRAGEKDESGGEDAVYLLQGKVEHVIAKAVLPHQSQSHVDTVRLLACFVVTVEKTVFHATVDAHVQISYPPVGIPSVQFSSLERSMLTCFMVLINENSVFYAIMSLTGWSHVSAIIFWFLYIILMVFILFNFLIAIIVDAFMDVKVCGMKNGGRFHARLRLINAVFSAFLYLSCQ